MPVESGGAVRTVGVTSLRRRTFPHNAGVAGSSPAPAIDGLARRIADFPGSFRRALCPFTLGNAALCRQVIVGQCNWSGAAPAGRLRVSTGLTEREHELSAAAPEFFGPSAGVTSRSGPCTPRRRWRFKPSISGSDGIFRAFSRRCTSKETLLRSAARRSSPLGLPAPRPTLTSSFPSPTAGWRESSRISRC